VNYTSSEKNTTFCILFLSITKPLIFLLLDTVYVFLQNFQWHFSMMCTFAKVMPVSDIYSAEDISQTCWDHLRFLYNTW